MFYKLKFVIAVTYEFFYYMMGTWNEFNFEVMIFEWNVVWFLIKNHVDFLKAAMLITNDY